MVAQMAPVNTRKGSEPGREHVAPRRSSPARGERAASVDESPLMTVQRQRLQRLFGGAAPLPVSNAGQPVAQRLVIRIRDVLEMMGVTSSTIWKASKDTKKTMLGSDREKEDIGINQAVKGRRLDAGEELRVVAHGGAPSVPSLFSDGIPSLGGYAPAHLAKKLEPIFPQNYSGNIYLDGCYTGLRLDYTKGTSYIELFAKALHTLRGDLAGSVVGNIGTAATLSDSGEERITLTQEQGQAAEALSWPVLKVTDPKTQELLYKVLAPFGTACCDMFGAYGDSGLGKAVKERTRKAQEKIRRQEAMSKLKPQDLQTLGDIWNDLL